MEERMSLAELEAHLADVESRFKDLAAQYEDRDFTPEAQDEWDALKLERDKTREKIAKRKQREDDLRTLAGREETTEDEPRFSFQTRKQSVVPDDPTKIEEYRVRARSIEELERAYKDGAKKLIERYKPVLSDTVRGISREDAQADAEKLTDLDREVALRFILTSSPEYKREWANYVSRGAVGREMERTALSLTSANGGYAVPVELDTTLMLTNAGVINPIRGLARVRQTNVNTVEFINTTGITAAFNAEATEASDNSPTLAQPTVNIEKAFAFVPMSIEIAEDWAGIQADLAMAFADAKNQLESSKFLKGLGHGSHEPQGLIAAGGATAVVTTAATGTFAVADLYSLEAGLSPRYRARAAIVGNKASFQKVRQFDTAGGANLWVQLSYDQPATLLGYQAVEWSNYDSTPTTSGSTILTIGDFNYFAIVDRVGMNVEFIPHLFGSSNRYPTGQRGLYAYWRTSSQVLSPTLQANSAFVSLKVL